MRSFLVACLTVFALSVSSVSAAPQSFQILPGQGSIMVLLHRTNSLGHDHVMVNQSVTGAIETDPQDAKNSSFQLKFPVSQFVVDAPKWRKQAGGVFAAEFAEGDRADVKTNMLSGDVLDAKKFPAIEAFSESVTGSFPNLNIAVRFVIRGVEKTVTIPVTIKQQGKLLHAKAEFSIKQSLFDITPFSILFGMIGVKDQMDIRIDLTGKAIN